MIEIEKEILWATKIFEVIQGICHANETKIRTVNLLVEEEARIQVQPRELIPR